MELKLNFKPFLGIMLSTNTSTVTLQNIVNVIYNI